MKTLIAIVVASIVLGASQIIAFNLRGYHFENDYYQKWELSDKSSTITAKAKYVGEFIAALESGQERGEFASNSVMFLHTPNNSFSENLKALKTLSNRLNEIEGMDPTSFQYNTAIQQITQQEQGEAGSMIRVFYDCYTIKNYLIIWGWVGGNLTIIALLGIFIGGAVLFIKIANQ